MRQYVVLGAGLDTFAYRNPFPRCGYLKSIFRPPRTGSATCWTKPASRLPESLTYVPLDFEHKALAAGLAEAGFDSCRTYSSAGSEWCHI